MTNLFSTFSAEDKAFVFDLSDAVEFYEWDDGEVYTSDEYFALEDCDDSLSPSSYGTSHNLPSGKAIGITDEDTDGGTFVTYSEGFTDEENEAMEYYLRVCEVDHFTMNEIIKFKKQI